MKKNQTKQTSKLAKKMDKELDDEINEELDDETKKQLLGELLKLFQEQDYDDLSIYEQFIATQNPNIDNTIIEENSGDENKNSNNSLNFLEKEKTECYDKYNRTKLYLNFIKELITQQINTIAKQTDAIFQNDPTIQKKQSQHNEKLKQYKNDIQKYKDRIEKLEKPIGILQNQVYKTHKDILKLNEQIISRYKLKNEINNIKKNIKNAIKNYEAYLAKTKQLMTTTTNKELNDLKTEIINMLSATNKLKQEYDTKFNKLKQLYNILPIERQTEFVQIIESEKRVNCNNIYYSNLNKIKKMFNDIKILRNKIGSQTKNDVPEYIKNEKEIFFQSKIFNRNGIKPTFVKQYDKSDINEFLSKYDKIIKNVKNKQYSIISPKDIIEEEVNKLQK